MTRSQVLSAERAVRFDEGRHPRAKIGYVLLATEQTVEEDVMRLTPPGVGVHFTRAAIPDSITAETLADQAPELGEAAALILPDGSLDVICYACTSGSLVIGEERVFAELARGAPGAKTTSLITGVIRALRALGARKLVVATPYLDEINALEADYLEAAGFELLDIQGLNIERDSDMVRVTPDFIAEFAASLDRPDADAVFVSCGALRTLDVVESLERQLAKPIVCSNQAMIWDTLRLAGIGDRIPGYGRLLREH
jgi:maleate isomerase